MQDVAGLPLSTPLTDPPRRSRWRFHPFLDLALGVALVAGIGQAVALQGYQIYGHCMEPNLQNGERLLGSPLGLSHGIHRGDVVVFRPPHKPQTAFIKRVVGLPGELLEIRNSRVYVNGKLLDEPYLRFTWHDDRPATRIPADTVFVMGDNRDNSNDSRMWGDLPVSNIQAKVLVRYWPLNRLEVFR